MTIGHMSLLIIDVNDTYHDFFELFRGRVSVDILRGWLARWELRSNDSCNSDFASP